RIAEEFVVKAPAPAAQPGTIKAGAVHSSYSSFVTKHADPGTRPLRAVIDPANMMGVLDIAILQALGPALEIEAIYDTLDGTMPNHEANPLNKESLHDLQQSVIERRADLGIAYDGDADRVGFVDEQGRTIQPHLITALLARYFLSVHPGSPIAYDVPSSRSVRIEIETNGGIPLQTKVGTANIKTAMREHEAVFGGEFSGHYYFKDHFYSEAPSLIAVLVMNLMVRENAPLSELIASVQHYYHSGEMNFALEPDTDKNALLARFKSTYPDGELTEIDGVRVDYDDWWFLVRPSNTEPLMRMSVEAATPELLEKKKRELSHVIDKYV
ncbi:MAG: phosphomannomutase/phosphoglucomutase, partial [Candidatus Paceibacterota bacterium]